MNGKFLSATQLPLPYIMFSAIVFNLTSNCYTVQIVELGLGVKEALAAISHRQISQKRTKIG